VADAVLEQGVQLTAVRPFGVEECQRKDGGQLHRLFLDGHLPQQLLRALHWRELGVCRAAGGALLRSSGACQQKQHRRDDEGSSTDQHNLL
jgi:hypothetical protein